MISPTVEPVRTLPSTPRSPLDLRLVPQPEPPEQRPLARWVAIAAAVAMVASGIGIYVWQHGQVADRQADLDRARQQLTSTQQQLTSTQQGFDAALQRLTSARQRVRSLRSGVAALHDQVLRLLDQRARLSARQDALVSELSSVRASNRELLGRLEAVTARQDRLAETLDATRGRLADVRGQLQTARGEMLGLTGPALADGRYVGRLLAVANTEKRRLALRVFATVDGRSIDQPGWRMLGVAPNTEVRLLTWRGAGWTTVTFAWFAHAFNSGDPKDATVHEPEYWVRVDGGVVTGIGERRAR